MTAYEMRIRDWSSDVCSSDRRARFAVTSGKGAYMRALARDLAAAVGTCGHLCDLRRTAAGPFTEAAARSLENLRRSDERRVGKACVSTCGSRSAPYH